MPSECTYLGIDAGTTGLKLMLYDSDMREIGTASRNTVIYMPENGASEIDMDELWALLCEASQELRSTYPEAMAALRCIGVRVRETACGRLTRIGVLRAGQSCGTIRAARRRASTLFPG